jgi:hypothetical protein
LYIVVVGFHSFGVLSLWVVCCVLGVVGGVWLFLTALFRCQRLEHHQHLFAKEKGKKENVSVDGFDLSRSSAVSL